MDEPVDLRRKVAVSLSRLIGRCTPENQPSEEVLRAFMELEGSMGVVRELSERVSALEVAVGMTAREVR